MNGKLGAFYAKWVPYFAPGAAGGGAEEGAEHSHEEHMIFMLYRAILEEALQGFAAEEGPEGTGQLTKLTKFGTFAKFGRTRSRLYQSRF